MARRKKEDAAAIAEAVTATVKSAPGLNLRKAPAMTSPVIRVLPDGEKIALDSAVNAPDGWTAVMGGGYVMAMYIEMAK